MSSIIIHLTKLMFEHPASVNQSYWEHLQDALYFSFCAGQISLLLAIHALLPFLFTQTGSEHLDQLHQKMMAKRALLLKNKKESMDENDVEENVKGIEDETKGEIELEEDIEENEEKLEEDIEEELEDEIDDLHKQLEGNKEIVVEEDITTSDDESESQEDSAEN